VEFIWVEMKGGFFMFWKLFGFSVEISKYGLLKSGF